MKKLDKKLKAILEDNIDHAKRRLAAYKDACPDCRVFDDSLLEEADEAVACYSAKELYDKDDAYYCKTCHRCVYDRG